MLDVTGYRYDPVTGLFFNSRGKEIGSYTQKYGRIPVKKTQVSLSRLAVRLMTGEWPRGQVDHIDRNTHNNKWDNLRVCSRADNLKNSSVYMSNKLGIKGVFKKKFKAGPAYVASIQSDNKRIYLGRFETPEEAGKAYDEAAKTLHKEFANLNFKGN